MFRHGRRPDMNIAAEMFKHLNDLQHNCSRHLGVGVNFIQMTLQPLMSIITPRTRLYRKQLLQFGEV